MSNKPNKGFIKEIASNPKLIEKKKPFGWQKAIVPPKADGMATPYRIKEFKSAPKPKSNLVTETKAKRGLK